MHRFSALRLSHTTLNLNTLRDTSTSLSQVLDMEEQDAGFASEAADGRSSTHSGLFVLDDDRPTTPEPVVRPKLQRRRFPSFEIQVPPVKRRKTYVSYPEELVVSKVVGQASDPSGEVFYDVKCGDGEYVTVRNRCSNQPMLSLHPT